jgi:UDP-apiose/xylose synthase
MMREVAAEISGFGGYLEHPIEDVPSLEFYGAGYEDCGRRVPDLRKGQTRLGWRAKTDLRETLRITMQHYFDAYGRSAELPTHRTAEPATRPAVPSGIIPPIR